MGILRFISLMGLSMGIVIGIGTEISHAALAHRTSQPWGFGQVQIFRDVSPWLMFPGGSLLPWLVGIGLALGALVAFVWLHVYQQNRHWQRIELVRQEAKNFRERQVIRNVLDILDYEEYRTFYITHPEDGRLISFEATDPRLQRALRSHDQMSKTRRGLDEIKRLSQEPGAVSDKTLAVFEKYEKEEFFIEITLRDWFDSFLTGLEYFEIMIESGLATTEEFKPFIIYWVQIIGDRRFRRKGGSGFYDQLFHYIVWAGYSGVQRLFERFGYKILPPPYSTHDFNYLSVTDQKYDTQQALCLAKAAHLVYEDREYVNDIIRTWLSEDIDDRWMKMSDREYVVDVIKRWLKEGEPNSEFELRQNFIYFDMLTTDTQAFLFRKDNNIVLVFRGSQQLNDWRTNFKIRLKQFTILANQQALPPDGKVHRGFFDAWQSVEKIVVYYLRKWWTPETHLWVTGHSLGGALANMATISLDSQGFRVNGLYTFGQPRIADWQMVNHINRTMGDRIFRYANNNDIVPLIPPQWNPFSPFRLYGHMGQFRYFDSWGKLRYRSFMSQRWFDRLLGFLKALGKSGLDAVDDHKMEFYIANLQTAIQREEEAAKLEAERESLKGEVSELIQRRRNRKKAKQ